MRYRRIAADCHIDFPWLPAGFFTPNCSAALKDRMPYVAEGPDGPHCATKNVPALGFTCSVGSTTRSPARTPGSSTETDVRGARLAC